MHFLLVPHGRFGRLSSYVSRILACVALTIPPTLQSRQTDHCSAHRLTVPALTHLTLSSLCMLLLLCHSPLDHENGGRYVVHTGHKYGAHFVLYEGSPDECHSRYCVHIMGGGGGDSWGHISTMTRLMPVRLTGPASTPHGFEPTTSHMR